MAIKCSVRLDDPDYLAVQPDIGGVARFVRSFISIDPDTGGARRYRWDNHCARQWRLGAIRRYQQEGYCRTKAADGQRYKLPWHLSLGAEHLAAHHRRGDRHSALASPQFVLEAQPSAQRHIAVVRVPLARRPLLISWRAKLRQFPRSYEFTIAAAASLCLWGMDCFLGIRRRDGHDIISALRRPSSIGPDPDTRAAAAPRSL